MAPRPAPPERIVKPRKRSNWWKPIIAIDDDNILIENSGAIYPREMLAEIVIANESSLIVTHNHGLIVKELDAEFNTLHNWNFRATPLEREVWKPNRESKIVITDTVIGWFGFKGRYHYPLDPLTFSRKPVHELIPGDDPTLIKLMTWAMSVRQWSLEQGLPFKPSQGGLAAALLRDPRFYPDARRKVPQATNDRARPKLPGNYYELRTMEWRQHPTAMYLDQTASHHSCAKVIQFPCANTLYAKGRFHKPDEPNLRPYAKAGTPFFDRLIQEHGLFCLDVINKGKFADCDYPLPKFKTGSHRVYVYSNELAYLKEMGTHIESIIACWTSKTTDPGLNKYAEWALSEIANRPDDKQWLKPVLLSTYGVLAATPRATALGFRKSVKGQPEKFPVGGTYLDVQAIRNSKKREANIANVIHRGMIEAESRLRSIRFAKQLTADGYRVLAIYADSVFITTTPGQTLPFMPDGWKVEAALTRLQFINDVSFVSDTVTKLPGITGLERQRLENSGRRTRV